MPGLARNQIIRPDAAEYDMRELTPLPSAAGKVALIGVRKGTGIETATEFISAVKEGNLKFGSAGPLSAGRVIPVALGKEGDAYSYKSILDDYVYFDGKGKWYTAMKRGDVDVMAGEFSSVYRYVESGEVQPVLVISTEDSPPEQTPDVDTLADVDVSNPERVVTLSGAGPAYRVFVGPPGIPDERAKILRTAIMKALKNSELQKEAAKANRPISPADSDATGAALKRYISVWTKNKNLLDTLKNKR
jgi:tripartite-type tricarboxylate transporter receptor subunit TctC